MQPNIFKSAMLNGLIMGVLFSVNFLVSIPGNQYLNLLSYFVVAGIIFGIFRMSIRFRDTECEGHITYGKALAYIILIFFYAALISSIVKYIYFQFLNPEFLNELLQQSLKIMQQMKFKITDDMYDQMEKTLRPATFSLQFIWANVIAGVIVGLIMAAFVRKDKSIFEQ